ncbi:MAG: hypothetical protein ACI83D_000093 [Planctomycetota bacterium]|jgi:hypothetical protein
MVLNIMENMHYTHILINIGSTTIKVYGVQECRAQLLETKTLYLREGFHAMAGISEEKLAQLYAYINEIKDMYTGVSVSLMGGGLFRNMTPSVLDHSLQQFEEHTGGLLLSVLSLDNEQEYLQAAVAGRYSGDDPVILVDISGESTEVVLMDKGLVLERKSYLFGIIHTNHEFRDINDEEKLTGFHEVIGYVRSKLEPFTHWVQPKISFLVGAGLMFARALQYPLVVNTLFQDREHPLMIPAPAYYEYNEHIFSAVSIEELEKMFPENPAWMHGAKAYIGIAEAICRFYGADTVVPSDKEVIDGLVQSDFCSK